MEQLKMHSMNKADENIKRIGALFPNCVTERINADGKVEYAIDFDMLRQELSTVVVEGNEERYQFTWPDKKKSILAANAPISDTLRPCREESVDFDNTQNLYIEGDNLAVLKLLQETYLGKIKMIYIDPPYNTGNDFVYNDDFAEDASEYLGNSGQYTDEGYQLVQNTESNGRFHTDWLNMMYTRMKLAKDLLADDGVVFISLDDHEIDNMKKICNEIFGETNCVAQLVLVNNIAGRSDSKNIATAHEYALIYQKSSEFIANGMPLSAEQLQEYKYEDAGGKYRLQGLRKRGSGALRTDRPNMWYPIYYSEQQNSVSLNPNAFSNPITILPKLSDGTDGRWRWGKDTFEKKKHLIEIRTVSGRNEYDAYEKVYLNGEDGERTTKMKSFLLESKYTTDTATTEYKSVMEQKTFESPKAVSFIKDLVHVGSDKNAIVLDFFSGSATTAHAVMQLNAEDGGSRKFIMVQLPEVTDEKSEAFKVGYKTICEIGKERIRRSGQKIKDESGMMATELDTGFRVLKLDSSNMKDVFYNPAEYEISMFDMLTDNIKEDRTPEDLLFQVMLDLGVLLSSKIEETTIGGKRVFSVADGFLIACFDNDVTEETITAIAKKKPYYFVMRDSSMANDSVATNFEQIFATYSPDTERKVL